MVSTLINVHLTVSPSEAWNQKKDIKCEIKYEHRNCLKLTQMKALNNRKNGTY